MTLLFFDGLQDATLIPKPEWYSSVGWNGSAAGRDGTANSAATNAVNNGLRRVALPSSAATCIAGAAMKTTTIQVGAWPGVIHFMSDVNTVQLMTFVNASGLIEARKSTVNGTLLGTSSGHSPITVNTWNHYAVKTVLHTTSGSVTIQLNGVTVLTVTGVSTSTVTGPVTHIGFSSPNDTTSGYITWDDIYVCDAVDATATQGQPNNDFLGDVRVATVLPSAAGDVTQWTPSTGTNWSTVDEIPANTTDFVSDSVVGHQDLYQTVDPAGTFANVYGVRVGYYANKSDAGGVQLKPLLKENSVLTTDSAQGLATGFGSLWGTAKYVRPSDSGVWTQTDLNNLQIGLEVA